jgi:hypothetical protein
MSFSCFSFCNVAKIQKFQEKHLVGEAIDKKVETKKPCWIVVGVLIDCA